MPRHADLLVQGRQLGAVVFQLRLRRQDVGLGRRADAECFLHQLQVLFIVLDQVFGGRQQLLHASCKSLIAVQAFLYLACAQL